MEPGVLEGLCGVCGRSEGISIMKASFEVLDVVRETEGDYGL